MAPVGQKEYFYQWPYMVFGDTFENVLVLGAGSGTDVAAALKHGAIHVDAVEIDPVIVQLGREYHPDRPYSDPRVNVIIDDARHFLRTTTKKYDLAVFALIDSLTLQSSFSGVRLESYMFTEEAFRAVKRSARAERVAGRLQLLPRTLARRSPGKHLGGGLWAGTTCARPRSACLSWCVNVWAETIHADKGSIDPGARHRLRAVARTESGTYAQARCDH